MARKRRATAPAKPKIAGDVGGVSVCFRCFESVDLTAFRDDKIAGRLPIVHACGRVLLKAPA